MPSDKIVRELNLKSGKDLNITCTNKSREGPYYFVMLEKLHASSLQYRFPF